MGYGFLARKLSRCIRCVPLRPAASRCVPLRPLRPLRPRASAASGCVRLRPAASYVGSDIERIYVETGALDALTPFPARGCGVGRRWVRPARTSHGELGAA